MPETITEIDGLTGLELTFTQIDEAEVAEQYPKVQETIKKVRSKVNQLTKGMAPKFEIPPIILCTEEGLKRLTDSHMEGNPYAGPEKTGLGFYLPTQNAIYLAADKLEELDDWERYACITEEIVHAATTIFNSKKEKVRIGFCKSIPYRQERVDRIADWEFGTLTVSEEPVNNPAEAGEGDATHEERDAMYGDNGELLVITENLTSLIVELILAPGRSSKIGIGTKEEPPKILMGTIIEALDKCVSSKNFARTITMALRKSRYNRESWNAAIHKIFTPGRGRRGLHDQMAAEIRRGLSWETLTRDDIMVINARRFDEMK